jgi:hypothetical protein
MKLITRARAGYLVTLASGIAIGLAIVGTASAAPGAPAPAPVTHHYTIAASAFAPDELDITTTTNDYFNQWDPTALTNSGDRCFNAGLALPPGATLTSVTVYYAAGDAAMYFELNRQELSNHTGTAYVSFNTSTTGTPGYTSTTKTIPSADAVVNMGKYAYSAGVCPSGNTFFSGLNITYTVPG